MKTQTVNILAEEDILSARRMIRDFMQSLGFGIVDQTKLATATSELARNIFRYACPGTVTAEYTLNPRGIRIIFIDEGPGIEDIDLAMEEGFSTTPGSLGLGLIGAKRLADEMIVESELGKGTTITLFKAIL